MRQLFVAISASLLLFIGCSKKNNPGDILTSYLDSHNSHDVEATMQLFHEEARFTMPGRPPITDIRKMESWDAAISSNLNYESWEVRGDTLVIGRITERNNWFSKAGIPVVEYNPGSEIILRDGKIYEIRMAEMTEESQRAIGEMFSSFFTWAEINRPEELARLMPQGQIVMSENMAKEWFLLLDLWQRSK